MAKIIISLLSCGKNIAGLLLLGILSVHLLYGHVIKTKLGLLEGVTKEARNRKLFHAYYGVPYAKPPVGKLRFEPPVAADPWTGIFNATEIPEPCSQISSQDGIFKGLENCLYMHIYTPTNLKPGSNVPVIFYIFGGKFDFGDASDNGPEYVMSRDVILVMVSFRLGVFGFLSTGDSVIPGNMGLKDQTLAMKWTKENIYEFGGDLHRITLHGHSSGASCAHLHTFSPLSQQYFHQIILQSGLGISPQSFSDPDFALGITRALAGHVKCPSHSSEELKQCLQKKTDRELAEAGHNLYIWANLAPTTVFRPVIEDKSVENAFLSENPLDASYVAENKPLLVGISSDEATKVVDDYFNPDSSILNIDSKLLLPIIGFFGWTSKPNHVNFITRTLKTYFFGEEDLNNTTDIADIALVKMLNGIMYGYAFIDVVQKYKGLKYAYLYDYRYKGGFTHSKGGRGGRFLGVGHADDLPQIFMFLNTTGITEEDLAFGDEIITRLINFVHSGNPNVPFPINATVFGAWSPISSSRIEFLRIVNGGGMERDYFVEEYGFWRKIPLFSKYR